MIVTPVQKNIQSITVGFGTLIIGLLFSATATSALNTEPVVVTQNGGINVNSALRVTSVRDGRGLVKVFPVPQMPQNPFSYACKRIDIALIPYGLAGIGLDGGESFVRGGCANVSSPPTISATFQMVAYARKWAEDYCKSKEPTGQDINTTLTVPFLVKRRYCLLDMEGNAIPGGTHWSVDCGSDGIGVEETIYFPVDVSCEKRPLLTYARVNKALEYSCPHTSKENEAFWQNFRLVVEGTYSYKVLAKESLGTPRCIRIKDSDGSNTGKIFTSSND